MCDKDQSLQSFFIRGRRSCGLTVMVGSRSDHGRIMLGSFSDRSRIGNDVSSVFTKFAHILDGYFAWQVQ